MIRKPQPKDAARAIISLFAAKGIEVPLSLALETVATVEGYNDWNAMSKLVPDAKEKSTKKGLKAPELQFPEISDDDGPFGIYIGGGHYSTMERFSRACEVAEMFAGEDSANNQPVTITNRVKKVVAGYIDPDKRYRVVKSRVAADLTESLKASYDAVFAKYDVEWLMDDRAAAMQRVKELVRGAVADKDAGIVLGLQEYVCDKTGRVLDANPPLQYVAHTWLDKATVALSAPQDVRETLATFLNV